MSRQGDMGDKSGGSVDALSPFFIDLDLYIFPMCSRDLYMHYVGSDNFEIDQNTF
jgi:hypothetical protein